MGLGQGLTVLDGFHLPILQGLLSKKCQAPFKAPEDMTENIVVLVDFSDGEDN